MSNVPSISTVGTDFLRVMGSLPASFVLLCLRIYCKTSVSVYLQSAVSRDLAAFSCYCKTHWPKFLNAFLFFNRTFEPNVDIYRRQNFSARFFKDCRGSRSQVSEAKGWLASSPTRTAGQASCGKLLKTVFLVPSGSTRWWQKSTSSQRPWTTPAMTCR